MVKRQEFPVTIYSRHVNKYERLFYKHFHTDWLQFIYFTKGISSLYCSSHHFEFRENEILCINMNELHYSDRLSQESDFYVIKIHIDALKELYGAHDWNKKYVQAMQRNIITFQNKITSEVIFHDLQLLIREDAEKKFGYELHLISLLYDILTELFRTQIVEKKAEELLKQENNTFFTIFDYIELNFQKEISLEKIAAQADMSKGYFCTKFKQITGKSLSIYLNKLRIEKAVRLLQEKPDMQITDIALNVGYKDLNYFCRIFKNYMNTSPSCYRKQLYRQYP